MFMKCFKKKLATGLLVVSVVCGLSSGAFADSGKTRVIYETENTAVRSFIDGDNICYVAVRSGYGAISISCVKNK